jgi:hypothetical protein
VSGDPSGVDHGGVCDLGLGEAICEEGGGVEMDFKKLGRKTRLLAIMVSACLLIIGLLLGELIAL